MRVLVIDTDDTGLDTCWRAVEAGHEVKWWIALNPDRTPSRSGDGFPGIEKVSSWQPHMTWAKSGVIINLFNDRKIVKELEKWRAFGFPIFGPSEKSAELEHNRGMGMKFMEDHGIEVPEYHTFKNLDECIKFAWKAHEPFVYKTMGDCADKSLSYVASDPADLVGWLEMKRDQGVQIKGDMMLQHKIDMIAEVGISGWLGKEGFLPDKWNVNFETKKLMPGDYGPNTGEMLTVTKYTDKSKMADEVLKPFEEAFVAMGHRGDADIGCGIDSKGKIHPFEFSLRNGWPSSFILFASHTCDPIEWMREAVVTGNDLLTVDDRVAMGVIMARPPFPTANPDPQSNVGYPITGIEEVWGKVSPWQMRISDGPVMKDGKVEKGKVYQTTGDYVCCVTAHGHDLHDIIPEVYETVGHIKFSDRIVRNDGGKNLEKILPKLVSLGFDEVPNW